MGTNWLEWLEPEDFTFMRNFILASGSLKEVARNYGVSYPTVRLRLDRLIAKIKVMESMQAESEFEKLLRVLYAEGKIDRSTLDKLYLAYQQSLQQEKSHEN